mmetsp:Transcript_76365/g.171302  ORF Transcript_76365/g.171302 Transcript_76365/m.171302 type:complete len:211 (-) Transcript_76365:44-676(-)
MKAPPRVALRPRGVAMGQQCVANCKHGRGFDGEELTEEFQQRIHARGRWVSRNGNVHIVGADDICWADGTATKLTVEVTGQGRVKCLTSLNGKSYMGELVSVDKIQWDDGDVWLREKRGPETATSRALSLGYEHLVSGVFGGERRASANLPEFASYEDPSLLARALHGQQTRPKPRPKQRSRTPRHEEGASDPSLSPRPAAGKPTAVEDR